ncbi:MAG: ABC transporter permease [Bacteroidales bacterium]
MTRIQLIMRNLRFFRKQYLAVMAGIVVSTAVLTGALIVGDSVRYSLKRLTDIRLGKTKFALQANERFFSQQLADAITRKLNVEAIPVLISGGIAINSDKNLRINQVQVSGIDERFCQLWDQPLQAPASDEAIISSNVAERLNLKPGDELMLRIQNQGKAPSNAPFVSEKMPSYSVRLKVSAITNFEQMGRFSLKNNQAAPFNVFISLQQMTGLLKLTGFANTILVADSEGSKLTAHMLDSIVGRCWKPQDAGLHIRLLPGVMDRNYEISSDRIFFDKTTVDAIQNTIPGCDAILTYLVNSLSSGNSSTPYSFVTAASESFLRQAPGTREIMISEWLANDLHIGTGDSIMLRYFLMGPLRSLHEDSTMFSVKSVVASRNSIADRGLMPDFPGMSGAGNCRDWETGAPVNLKKIREKDEAYWKSFRGTPKAFISLEAGQALWGNRFGNITLFRFKAGHSEIPGIEEKLMQRLDPLKSGLSFRPVFEEGERAASNSTDFGELFLSLSFFIILSSLLLTAMLFSMLAKSRAVETGLLASIGFRKTEIMIILAGEALLATLAGVVLGTFGGMIYNRLLILGLNTIWLDAVNTSYLVSKVNLITLGYGAAISLVTSMAVLLFTLWKNLGNPLSMLVKGVENRILTINKKQLVFNFFILLLFLGSSISLLFWQWIHGTALSSSVTLAAGGLLLPGGLALLNIVLAGAVTRHWNAIPGAVGMALKNLALNRARTLSAVALLAIGTFTIVITGANRKTISGHDSARKSGTGGFILWGESTLPVMDDLNTPTGSGIFGLKDESVLKNVRFVQLPGLAGDDASCLNLNQVSQPGILGVPANLFNKLNAFTFVSLVPSVKASEPWKTLGTKLADDVIPGFCDQTVITWGLRKSVGDTLIYRDESGNQLKIKLMGGLDNSIFQGHILVSDSLLRVFFPSAGGARVMLVDGPKNQQDTISHTLERLFRDVGLMTTPASVRLASFNVVENTYLSVFMLLGGLGVVIGTIGLGIVLLRNISRRRKELALFVAIGFRKQLVFKMILLEHLLILGSGITLGLIASLPLVFPLLISPDSQVPWLFIAGILSLIVVNGILWIFFPAKALMHKTLISGLRNE